MVRLSKKWIALAFLCMVGLNVSSFSAALPYNVYLEGGVINSYPRTDLYTRISNQICDFKITRLNTQQKNINQSYSFDQYSHGDIPEAEWGAIKSLTNTMEIISAVSVYKMETPIIWEERGTNSYPSSSHNASGCLNMEHFSLNENYNSKNNKDAIAFHAINDTTLGEVSVDIMPHLSYLASNEAVSDGSEGVLHVELSHQDDTTPAVNVTFKTQPYEMTQYQLLAYIETLNLASGEKNIPVLIFEGYPDDFNWVNLKIFYDTYNDVYNITIGQYTHDFKDYLVQPRSTIIQGSQHRNNTLYNVGFRYAEGELINKINFKLKSFATDNRKSYVYISNLATKGFEFPAIYADVTLKNATILEDPETASGIAYRNHTIISSYEPPQYPDGSYSISYGDQYLLNPSNKGFLSVWNFAPAWVYALPLVVTNDHSLNVASILRVMNDLDWPLEERGLVRPSINSEYSLTPENRTAARFFELNENLSSPYYYYFKSRYQNVIMVIEYNYGSDNSGILKSVHMHENNIKINPFFEFESTYKAADITSKGPDLPEELLTGVLIGLVGVAIVAIIYYKRKHTF